MGVASWGPDLGDGTKAVTLYLEADLGDVDTGYQPNAWGIGKWGEFVWQGGPTWTDITDRIHKTGLTVEARFERATQNFTGWTLKGRLRNDDGALSRHNSQSPYYLPGIGSTIRSGAPVRLRAMYNNGATVREWLLFVGYLKTWHPVYDSAGFDPTVQMGAVDDFVRLADFDGYEQTPVGAGEYSGARITRVLDSAGHIGPRTIAVGKHTMQATTLASNALAELKLTADSEGGAVYSTGSGRIVFEDQDALATIDRSVNVQVTFANDGTPGALQYLADGVQPRYDDRLLVTDVGYARVGGTMQTVSSTRARAQHRGIVQERRTDLICQTDPQAKVLARRALALRKEVRERIDGLTVVPDAQFTDTGAVDPVLQAAAWEAISSDRLGLLSLVRTIYKPVQPPVGSIDTFDELEHVQGITHTITPVDWRVDLSFSNASLWYGISQSRWGIGRWGEFVWWI